MTVRTLRADRVQHFRSRIHCLKKVSGLYYYHPHLSVLYDDYIIFKVDVWKCVNTADILTVIVVLFSLWMFSLQFINSQVSLSQSLQIIKKRKKRRVSCEI